MTDPQRLDPALLSQGEPDEKTELNEFFSRKVLMQLFPECVVGNFRIPDDRARIGQRDFFPFRKFIRFAEIEQVVILVLGQTLPSSLDGSLDASILTIDGL